MQNKLGVREAEVEAALAGQRVFIPDAAGELWVLWSDGRRISLTKDPQSVTIPIAASQGPEGVSERLE